MCPRIVCLWFEVAQEQRTGDVFVLFVERVKCLHNVTMCLSVFYFSACKTELELKLREILAQILGK